MTSPLDIECFDQLLSYLRERGHIRPEETPRLTNLAGGVSNRAVLVEPVGGASFVLKQALERLRVAVEWWSDPRRIEREALGLEWLGQLAPAGTIPSLLFLDKEQHLLAMQAVAQPHLNWKSELLNGRLEMDHIQQFGWLLATIHRESRQRQTEIAEVFEDRSFFESLRLEPYYQYTSQQVPEASAFLSALIEETIATRLALVHGDFSPKNILIRSGRLILLDHEVVHYGDPAFDLGFSLTHLLSKAHHLPAHRPLFLQAADCYWETYREAVRCQEEMPAFESRAIRHTLACLLARAMGRSPLEYLSLAERAGQREIVLKLISRKLATLTELIGEFGGILD